MEQTTQAVETSNCLHTVKAYIDTIDFSEILNKLAQEKGWTKHTAELACVQYKRYLYLQKKYGKQYSLIPSKDIDDFWHLHILDTKKYQIDCQNIFGCYMHHRPFYKENNNSALEEHPFEITRKLYYQEFGEHLCRVRLNLIESFLYTFAKSIKRFFNFLSNIIFVIFFNGLRKLFV